jgi:hypothetical protein
LIEHIVVGIGRVSIHWVRGAEELRQGLAGQGITLRQAG